MLSSVPCCSAPAVSLPFTSVVVKNLLAVVSCGVSLPLRGEDLLTVKVDTNPTFTLLTVRDSRYYTMTFSSSDCLIVV